MISNVIDYPYPQYKPAFRYKCRSCNRIFRILTVLFERKKCPACGSPNIKLVFRIVEKKKSPWILN